MHRHPNLKWDRIEARLQSHGEKLWSLYEMEDTGGEPDAVAFDEKTGEYTFWDCSAESPAGRRSLCYDREALEARKTNKPRNSAVDAAAAMGIELISESAYRNFQAFGPFDQKTSSWLLTPPAVRALGGALFGDYRFGRVFVYHNGAPSYYASRGFRGLIRI